MTCGGGGGGDDDDGGGGGGDDDDDDDDDTNKNANLFEQLLTPMKNVCLELASACSNCYKKTQRE